jgi:predicted TIM-barrel fold metal-dependent hydrolase
MMVIDSHCHAGTGEAMTAPWTTRAPLRAYLRRAKRAGIQKTVIFSLFRGDYAKGNAEVAHIVARHPGRLIGFAFVHTKRDAGQIRQMVAEAVKRWNFRGIKVHGFEGMPTREVCEAAREFQLPLLVDVAGKTQVIDLFAPEYPDVNFIIPHLGSFMDDWGAHARVIEQLVKYPNVFADTSAVRRFDYIVDAVRRAGPAKILFGSDGPWLHPGVELHKIRVLGLPKAQEALITGGNLLRLIRNSGQTPTNAVRNPRLEGGASDGNEIASVSTPSLESDFPTLQETPHDRYPF